MKLLEPNDIPRHTKRASRKRKRFGIERYSRWFKRWSIWKWYHTKKQRDQAFNMLIKHTCAVFKKSETIESLYLKIERE